MAFPLEAGPAEPRLGFCPNLHGIHDTQELCNPFPKSSQPKFLRNGYRWGGVCFLSTTEHLVSQRTAGAPRFYQHTLNLVPDLGSSLGICSSAS